MKFVAQGRTIGPVGRKAQFLNEHGDNLVARRVVRQFNRDAFVFGGIVNRYVDGCHRLSTLQEKTSAAFSSTTLPQNHRGVCALPRKIPSGPAQERRRLVRRNSSFRHWGSCYGQPSK